MKKSNKEEFVVKANKIHNNKYGYDKFIYVNAFIKSIIICPIHGEFQQSPNGHLSGKSCQDCGGRKRLTTDIFIKRALVVHGNKYNYSKTIYKDDKTKVIIVCPIHGEFSQLPSSHLKNRAGCPDCFGNKKLTFETFLIKAIAVHGDRYDYSQTQRNFKNNRSKITILCSVHGQFKQAVGSHLTGCGCPKCAGHELLTIGEFVQKAKQIHGNKYNYTKFIYIKSNIKGIVICPIHGEFPQRPNDHLAGKGCWKCNESQGEKNIDKFLTKNNIKFERQKRFKDCKNKQPLPFDFHLPDYKILIEYDGEQHFKPINFQNIEKIEKLNKNFKELRKRDKIKNKWAKSNGYKLIRISYKKFDKIEKILGSLLIKNYIYNKKELNY